MKKTFFIILGIAMSIMFFFNTTANSSELYSKTIEVSNNYSLKINESKDNTLVFELFFKKSLKKTAVVKNASTKDDLIKKVVLSKENIDYFITAYDKTSTFGAQTNVIVWRSGLKWSMVVAPFTRGFVEDRDKDGIYELVDYYPAEKIYSFRNGVFILKK